MAAYAALISLNYIIEQLQHHPRPPISIDQNHVQSLIENVRFLQKFLEDYSHVRNEEVDQLQSRIEEAAHVAEDVIESHIVDEILAQSTTHENKIGSNVDFYRRLQKVTEDMDLIKKEVMEIKEKIGSVQDFQQHRGSSMPAVGSSRSQSKGLNTMVGFDDESKDIMNELRQQKFKRQIISVVGMGGIGKTTLATNVYENPFIVQYFDIRGWVTISQEYSLKEILLELLDLDQGRRESLNQFSEAELGVKLYQSLCGRRYLIILDDVWNIDVWDKLNSFFPGNDCGCGIIITSRLSNLALDIGATFGLQMSFLSDDKSWELFCKIVFGEDCCPLELEKSGKKIVENCKGLPLSIVVIGGLLAKSDQTQIHWKSIEQNLNSTVNLEDNERCLNLLRMSYNYLPIHLKPCFLYMGIFGEDDKIHTSEIKELWVAEGFLKPISGKSLEEVAEEYLEALVDRNLMLVHEWKHTGEIKSCKMHDLLRDLCIREAQKDNFFCATRMRSLINFSQDLSIQCDLSIQRRIAIHQRRSKLDKWVKKREYYLPEICYSLQSAALARSLIGISLKRLPSPNFRLSRVLKDYDELIYERDYSLDFPFQLVNLRYCAFVTRCSYADLQTIPSSTHLFWNLQTLIVRHVLTNTIDIWKMPLLRHVKFVKSHLTNPRQDDLGLWNLQTLSGIQTFKFGEEVVKRISNIKTLKIRYDEPFPAVRCCLNNLGHLHKLEDLNCFFGGEKPMRIDLVKNLTFPYFVKKLTLKNCGLHWGDMSTKIGSLPHLQVLKLRDDSFIGPEWETVEDQFLSLKFLLICCKELECWITEASHFPCLEHLVLNGLRSLQEIPSDLGNVSTLKLMEVDDCGNDAVISAREIANEQAELDNQDLQVRVRLLSRSNDLAEELKNTTTHNFILHLGLKISEV